MRELSGAGPIDARVFGFRWGPRLNAGGRMEDASDPVALLLSRDLETARPLAARCQAVNRARQQLQQEIETAAVRMATQMLDDDPARKILLLCARDWHPGIVGIVAGRLRERFVRPVIVCGWHQEGYWKGSGRSPECFDLGAAVQAAVDEGLLLAGGGHRMAAGLRLDPEKVEALGRWLETRCEVELDEFAPAFEVLAPVEAPGTEDTNELARRWCVFNQRLEPFGAANPPPVLRLSNALLRWGPKAKTRRDGGECWGYSAGFEWAGRGLLFADWTDLHRAPAEWKAEQRYDVLLTVSSSDGADRRTGAPVTYYNWRVVDCGASPVPQDPRPNHPE